MDHNAQFDWLKAQKRASLLLSVQSRLMHLAKIFLQRQLKQCKPICSTQKYIPLDLMRITPR